MGSRECDLAYMGQVHQLSKAPAGQLKESKGNTIEEK